MKSYLVATLFLSILGVTYGNAATLKVLQNTQQGQITLIDTTVKEILGKDIRFGDRSHKYEFGLGKWSCDASYVRFMPESAGEAILNCGNHDGLVISSTGDSATYLEINDGRDIEKPIQKYEIRLVGKPAK